MKWFVILAVLMGVYYWMLISSMNMALDQTKSMEQRYTMVANQADKLASDTQVSNR